MAVSSTFLEESIFRCWRSARRIFFEINLISQEICRGKHEYMDKPHPPNPTQDPNATKALGTALQ